MIRLILFILLAVPSFSQAHTRLKATAGVIATRSTDPGVKTAPCGGYARNANPATLQPGQTITVTWEETIQHPGYFEIRWSNANDANFTLLKTIADTQDDQNLPHPNSTTVTLPSTPCAACTLQLIQVMTENPTNPTMYYSCADMRLVAAVTATPTPTPTPVTTAPTPSPTPDCVTPVKPQN